MVSDKICPACLLYGGEILKNIYNNISTKKDVSTEYRGDSHIKLSYNIYRRLSDDPNIAEFKNLYINWKSNAGDNSCYFYSDAGSLVDKCNSLENEYNKRLVKSSALSTYGCKRLCTNAKLSTFYCRMCPLSREYVNGRIDAERSILGYAILNNDLSFLDVSSFYGCNYRYVFYEDIASRYTGSCIVGESVVNVHGLVAYCLMRNYDNLADEHSGLSRKLLDLLSAGFDSFYDEFCQLLFDSLLSLAADKADGKKYPAKDYYGGLALEDVVKSFRQPVLDIITSGRNCSAAEYSSLLPQFADMYTYSDYSSKCGCKDNALYVNQLNLPPKAPASDSLMSGLLSDSPLLKSDAVKDMINSENSKLSINNINSSQSTSNSNNTYMSLFDMAKGMLDDSAAVAVEKGSSTVDDPVVEEDVVDDYSSTPIDTENNLNDEVCLDNMVPDVENEVKQENVELLGSDYPVEYFENPPEYEYEDDNPIVDLSFLYEDGDIALEDGVCNELDANAAPEAEVNVSDGGCSNEDILADNIVSEDCSEATSLSMTVTELFTYSICEQGFDKELCTFFGASTESERLQTMSKCLAQLQGTSPVAVDCCWHHELGRYGILICVDDVFWYITEDCECFDDICWHLFSSNRVKVCINSTPLMSLLTKKHLRAKNVHSLSSLYYACNYDKGLEQLLYIQDIMSLELDVSVNLYKQLLPHYVRRYDELADLFDTTDDCNSANSVLNTAIEFECLGSLSFDMSDILDAPVPHISFKSGSDFNFKYDEKLLILNSGFSAITLSFDKMFAVECPLEFYKDLLLLAYRHSCFVKYRLRLLEYDDAGITFACPTSSVYTINDVLIDIAKKAYTKRDNNKENIPKFVLSSVTK